MRPVDVDKHWQENAAVLEARPPVWSLVWSKNPENPISDPISSGFFFFFGAKK